MTSGSKTEFKLSSCSNWPTDYLSLGRRSLSTTFVSSTEMKKTKKIAFARRFFCFVLTLLRFFYKVWAHFRERVLTKRDRNQGEVVAEAELEDGGLTALFDWLNSQPDYETDANEVDPDEDPDEDDEDDDDDWSSDGDDSDGDDEEVWEDD
ncbi:MAG: hypothetical protein V1716_03085 [Candidatus Uhrbacteria bacterium]